MFKFVLRKGRHLIVIAPSGSSPLSVRLHQEFNANISVESNFHVIRERSFLILGSRAEDFWQGHESFFLYCVGVQKCQEQFLWDTKLFSLKRFWIKSLIKD